jgi:ABC-2 type transport system ATP-binding protein
VVDLDGVGRAAALQALVADDIAVEQFTPRRHLEEAFLALVGESNRGYSS